MEPSPRMPEPATSHQDNREAPARHDAPPRRLKVGRYLVLAALVLCAAAAYGILERGRSEAELVQWTNERAIANVDLVTPQHATMDRHLALPADVAAFYTAPIHARVNGYVKMWYFDIGAKVKAGDVLARVDTPELDQQYEQAKGELAKAKADYDLALLTANRWEALRASQAVSRQTADEKAGDAQARKAEVFAAQAHVDRVKAMEDFKVIVAPFAGIITARRIDVGALVSATNADAKGLFELAATDRMRVYVRVPQIDSADMRKGLKVTLTLPQYPGRKFEGVIDTTSSAISDTSRALLVEAIFPNPDGILAPGAYAQARFDLPLDPHKLVIPASALIFRNEAPEVAVVKDGEVKLTPVTVLVDLGNQIEISTGLGEDDKIVKSPEDAIETGDKVRVQTIDGKKAGAAPSPVSDKDAAPGSTHEARK
jgi:RND family efflux transporter MFP subunit